MFHCVDWDEFIVIDAAEGVELRVCNGCRDVTGPRGIGGGSNPAGGEYTETITGRSDAHDFDVTFHIDEKQMVRIPHLDLAAGENMTPHPYNWTPLLLGLMYNLTAAAAVLSGEDWTEIETDNNAMTKCVLIEERGVCIIGQPSSRVRHASSTLTTFPDLLPNIVLTLTQHLDSVRHSSQLSET